MATKKEQMVINIINRKNYLRTLKNETLIEMDHYYISTEARKNNMFSLEDELKSIENAIQREETRIAAEKYWETHPDEKQHLEDKKAELKASYHTTRDHYLDYFNNLLAEYGMFVKYMSTTNLEIKSKANERYGFDINYTHNWDINRETKEVLTTREVEINYPCYGSFNPMKEPEFVQYLAALASVANNKQLYNEFESGLNQYNNEMDSIRDAISEIDEQIKNPIK